MQEAKIKKCFNDSERICQLNCEDNICGICFKSVPDCEWAVNWGACSECFGKHLETVMDKYEVEHRIIKQIESCFTYHAPRNDQPERYVLIRDKAKGLAYTIAKNTPSSREQALALTHLEEAVFYANAAIARNE